MKLNNLTIDWGKLLQPDSKAEYKHISKSKNTSRFSSRSSANRSKRGRTHTTLANSINERVSQQLASQEESEIECRAHPFQKGEFKTDVIQHRKVFQKSFKKIRKKYDYFYKPFEDQQVTEADDQFEVEKQYTNNQQYQMVFQKAKLIRERRQKLLEKKGRSSTPTRQRKTLVVGLVQQPQQQQESFQEIQGFSKTVKQAAEEENICRYLLEKEKKENLQKLFVDDHVFETFMKFENIRTEKEILDQLRHQAENPNARLDQNNPWAKIACVIIKSKKSLCLEKLCEKINEYRRKFNQQIKLHEMENDDTADLQKAEKERIRNRIQQNLEKNKPKVSVKPSAQRMIEMRKERIVSRICLDQDMIKLSVDNFQGQIQKRNHTIEEHPYSNVSEMPKNRGYRVVSNLSQVTLHNSKFQMFNYQPYTHKKKSLMKNISQQSTSNIELEWNSYYQATVNTISSPKVLGEFFNEKTILRPRNKSLSTIDFKPFYQHAEDYSKYNLLQNNRILSGENNSCLSILSNETLCKLLKNKKKAMKRFKKKRVGSFSQTRMLVTLTYGCPKILLK